MTVRSRTVRVSSSFMPAMTISSAVPASTPLSVRYVRSTPSRAANATAMRSHFGGSCQRVALDGQAQRGGRSGAG